MNSHGSQDSGAENQSLIIELQYFTIFKGKKNKEIAVFNVALQKSFSKSYG